MRLPGIGAAVTWGWETDLVPVHPPLTGWPPRCDQLPCLLSAATAEAVCCFLSHDVCGEK